MNEEYLSLLKDCRVVTEEDNSQLGKRLFAFSKMSIPKTMLVPSPKTRKITNFATIIKAF